MRQEETSCLYTATTEKFLFTGSGGHWKRLFEIQNHREQLQTHKEKQSFVLELLCPQVYVNHNRLFP